MKFAKELENELVPEWKVKYLDYKVGKKKIKAIKRALPIILGVTPRLGARWRTAVDASPENHLPYTYYDFTASSPDSPATEVPRTVIQNAAPQSQHPESRPRRRESLTILMDTPPLPMPESQPLKGGGAGHAQQSQRPKDYGSIIESSPPISRPSNQNMMPLQLPDPAINPTSAHMGAVRSSDVARPRSDVCDEPPPTGDAYHVGKNKKSQRKALGLPRHLFRSSRTTSAPEGPFASASPVRRMLSGTVVRMPSSADVPLGAYPELDQRQKEFFSFLDNELKKIDGFYRVKEAEASARLQVLKAQLHEMRDRSVQAIARTQRRKEQDQDASQAPDAVPNGIKPDHGPGLLKPFEAIVSRKPNVGETTKAMTQLGSPSRTPPADPDGRQDYVKRADHNQHVPYRVAKKKLKVALQEFYRALELLKSYALVNRTAFRKINKKYDKAVRARPTGRYMTLRVSKAHFVSSDHIEDHIVAVEDLYSRYFERGNRKIAVAKLQSQISRSGDHSQTAFRNGIWLAAGAALGIQGIVNGFQILRNPGDPLLQVQTSFLLQLYGGYFLGVLLFLLFTLDCYIWTQSRINYIFVFEFDSRNVLDWRDLAELPSFFFFLNGLFIWLNFREGGGDPMFLYWPAVLIVLSLLVMCLPLRLLYHRSRRWWGYSNWRLLLAGLYPVEFRDFFLGDMYCSLTYSMGNIEVFFCLYAQGWSNPPLCNSSHSRLLGFFAALPAIWRALQCIRRYRDSRKWFPHLANLGKYSCSILYYVNLSLYRIDKRVALRVPFILFAAVNALYCSAWDIAMDWSLGNPYSARPFLRKTLGYRRVWTYYMAMIVDPVLRFAWIFYLVFERETQHSTLVSFIIAMAEVARRSLWAAFRVENEHCANVGRFRASRDVPLPYSIAVTSAQTEESERPSQEQASTLVDLEQAPTTSPSPLRRRKTQNSAESTPMRRGINRVGTMINQAHTQDFERKSRASFVGDNADSVGSTTLVDSSDDDDDDDEINDASRNDDDDDVDTEQMLQAREIVNRAKR